MNSGPSVIVNKSGFLASLAKGVFGTIMVALVCATALGIYGIHISHNIVGGTLLELPELVRSLPEWRSLPPVLADALNDRQAPEYEQQLEIDAQLRPVAREHGEGRGVVAIEVTNKGSEVVSLMSLRLTVESDGPDYTERALFVATPFTLGECDCDWRGPLQPGKTRRILQHVAHLEGTPRVSVELTGLRVLSPREERVEQQQLTIPTPVNEERPAA